MVSQRTPRYSYRGSAQDFRKGATSVPPSYAREPARTRLPAQDWTSADVVDLLRNSTGATRPGDTRRALLDALVPPPEARTPGSQGYREPKRMPSTPAHGGGTMTKGDLRNALAGKEMLRPLGDATGRARLFAGLGTAALRSPLITLMREAVWDTVATPWFAENVNAAPFVIDSYINELFNWGRHPFSYHGLNTAQQVCTGNNTTMGPFTRSHTGCAPFIDLDSNYLPYGTVNMYNGGPAGSNYYYYNRVGDFDAIRGVYQLESHIRVVDTPMPVMRPRTQPFKTVHPMLRHTWIYPMVAPVQVPMPTPSPVPYKIIPHRQANPFLVEQTVRGHHVVARFEPWSRTHGMQGTGVHLRSDGRMARFTPSRVGQRTRYGSGNKERKGHMGGLPAGLLKWAVNTATEGMDLVHAAFDALPDECKKGNRQNTRQIGAVYRCWQHMDMKKFINNVINNQIEDMMVGAAGRLGAKSNEKFAMAQARMSPSKVANSPLLGKTMGAIPRGAGDVSTPTVDVFKGTISW